MIGSTTLIELLCEDDKYRNQFETQHTGGAKLGDGTPNMFVLDT